MLISIEMKDGIVEKFGVNFIVTRMGREAWLVEIDSALRATQQGLEVLKQAVEQIDKRADG